MKLVHSEEFWGLADKPAGLSVHNDPGKDLVSLLGEKFKTPAHLINRLDAETSGLVLYVLRPDLVEGFQNALADSKSQKIYQAVLRGVLPSPENGHIDWNWPLSDKAEGRRNPQGESQNRKDCLTQVSVKQKNRYLTLIECRLMTGRQHQIRKHAALSDHAILGDSRYGDAKYNEKMRQIYGSDRLFLHCGKLKFKHDKKDYEFTSPWPLEFTNLFIVKNTNPA